MTQFSLHDNKHIIEQHFLLVSMFVTQWLRYERNSVIDINLCSTLDAAITTITVKILDGREARRELAV